MPRVHAIKYPSISVSAGIFALVLTLFGMAVLNPSSPRTQLPATVCFGFGLFFWLLFIWQWHRIYHKPHLRMRRLRRLLARKNQRLRFTHRLIEHRHRSLLRSFWRWGVRWIWHWELRTAMRYGRGDVIVANSRKVSRPLPRGGDDGFEPMPLHGDPARLADLAALEEQPNPERTNPAQYGLNHAIFTSAFPSLRHMGRRISSPGRMAKYVIISCILLALFLPTYQASPVFAIVFYGVLFLIMGVFYLWEGREYDWWLIPGGLVYRRPGVLGVGAGLRRIPAAEAVLFFDYREKSMRYAYVGHEGRLYRLACDTALFPYLLAAWLNRARTPTEDELRDMFTGNA